MRAIYIIISLAAIAAGCGNGNGKADAYGNFEVDEVLVSVEAQGKLLSFTIEEGKNIAKNNVVGIVDTLPLYLKREQLRAQIEASTARLTQVNAQVDVQEEQKKTIMREKSRIESLLKEKAAPAKQLDDINGQLNVVNSQITSIKTQNQSITGEIKALRFQLAQVQDQINKAIIRNPIDGNVLEKYVEEGEVVSPAKNLYKIANLSVLKLRVYISGDQLSHIKIGQQVKVFIDKSKDEMAELPGTITWVSQQAEFTPKIIQTKEERVNMVYAVKVDVKNDGSLKIGMPGEVKF